MANTLVAADFDLASNIGRYLTAKVTLHLEIGLNVLTQRQQLIVGEVLHADVGINPGRRQGLLGQGATNTINIGQGDFNPFVTGNIDSSETCHFFLLLHCEGLEHSRCPGLLPRSPPLGGIVTMPCIC